MHEHRSDINWAALVKALLKRVSKKHLATQLGVRTRTVTRWEEGETLPQENQAKALIRECTEWRIPYQSFFGLTPIYDFRSDFEKNLREGPHGMPRPVGTLPKLTTRVWENDLDSFIGLSSSPLTMNSEWIAPLCRLGFDIITTKTVRTKLMPPHPWPNVLYVPELDSPISEPMPAFVHGVPNPPLDDVSKLSLANSFGVPSTDPQEWLADLAETRSIVRTAKGQMLIVSIVGTADGDDSDLTDDFVACAELVNEIKPDAIELNLSCPNVYGKEGSVYENVDLAKCICERVRRVLPSSRLIAKTGYLRPDKLGDFFDATSSYVDGYTAINSVRLRVVSEAQRLEPVFAAPGRGECGVSGVAVREYALETVRGLRRLASESKRDIVLIGVGGISSADHVNQFLGAGADLVQMCTSAMLDPLVGVRIRNDLDNARSTTQVPLSKGSGARPRFRDGVVGGVYDAALYISEKLNVPWEDVWATIEEGWLARYRAFSRSDDVQKGLIKTRPAPPSESTIERMVRDAIKEKKI